MINFTSFLDELEKIAGIKDKLLGAGAAASVAGTLGMAGYVGRHEYKAMGQGFMDEARRTHRDTIKYLKSKKIGNLPVLR